MLYLAFAVAEYSYYSMIPVVMKLSSATVMNLSLLTSDVYTLLIGLFLFSYKVNMNEGDNLVIHFGDVPRMYGKQLWRRVLKINYVISGDYYFFTLIHSCLSCGNLPSHNEKVE